MYKVSKAGFSNFIFSASKCFKIVHPKMPAITANRNAFACLLPMFSNV